MTTKIRLLHDTVGIPTGAVAVTQSASDNTTKVATTAYVTTALANLADSAPSTLNTLNELAAALGDDANFSTTVTNSIATKLPLAGGTMTGTLKTPNLTINDGVQEFDKPSVKGFRFLHNDAGNDLSIQQGDTNNANYVTKFNISTDGNVLIGITSNNYTRGKFTVFGTPGNPATTGSNADNVAIRVATNTGNSQSFDIGMYNSGDYGAWLQASNSGSLNSHSPIVLNPNGGKVGIGTNSPTKSLSVKAPSGSNGGIDVFHSNGNKVAELVHNGSGDEGRLSLLDSGSTTVQIMGETGQNSYINSGNVGIGTSSPTMPLSVKAASNAYAINMHGRSDGYSELYGSSSDGSTKYAFLQTHSAQTKLFTLVNTPLLFGTNSTESYRIRTDGGLQFPDNNTFIATSNTAGGTAYEWGSIRRPAGSDGGQLSIRQYSTGDTAANYPAYAGGTSGWDENTGMFFYGTDEVGLTAAGNPTFWIEEGKKWEVYENGFTSGDSHRGQRICLGGISHNPSSNPGGTGTGTYLHIKTNVPKSNVMFRFEYKGYSYNDQNMDTSIVGYTYADVSYVYSPTIENAGDTDFCFKTPYYSSDNKLVLVLKIAANYTGGILWAQFVGSHCMAPGSTAIVSTINSANTSGAY